MKNSKITNEIKAFIAKGELEKAIEYGLQFLGTKEFILFASRFKRMEKSSQTGILTFDQYQVELNRLSNGILDLIHEQTVELKPKKRSKLIWFWVFTGLFTDWSKVMLLLKYVLFTSIGIIGIVIGVNLLEPEYSIDLVKLQSSTPYIVSFRVDEVADDEVADDGAVWIRCSFISGLDVECWFEDENGPITDPEVFLSNGKGLVTASLSYKWVRTLKKPGYKIRAAAKNRTGTTYTSWQYAPPMR